MLKTMQDEESPLSPDIPLDIRHVHARERKRPGLKSFRRAEAMRARPHKVGHVEGFPLEWLPRDISLE
jgi:small subunit ribosomal protein S35